MQIMWSQNTTETDKLKILMVKTSLVTQSQLNNWFFT